MRRLTLSATGRHVALRGAGGLELVDALGTNPRRQIGEPDALDFALVGDQLWVLVAGALRRYGLDGQRVDELAVEGDQLLAAPGERARTAVASGWFVDADGCAPLGLAAEERAFPLFGRRVAVAARRGPLRLVDVGRREQITSLVPGGRVLHVAPLFEGRVLVAVIRDPDRDEFVVFRQDGAVVHRIALPAIERWAIAPRRGVGFAYGPELGLVQLDLRYGRTGAAIEVPWPVAELACCNDGQYVALHEERGLRTIHASSAELFSRAAHLPRGERREVSVDAVDAVEPPVRAAVITPPPAPAPPPLPRIVPRALGAPRAPLAIVADPAWTAYARAEDHLEQLLDLVAARAARAIAAGWHTGLLSAPGNDGHPFEREVRALVGEVGGFALHQLDDAERRVVQIEAAAAGRARASVAVGMRLPFVELIREFALSRSAAAVLLSVAAPRVRGQIARLFGILGNDPNRPIVDHYLLEALGDDREGLAAALAPSEPLLRYGLIRGEAPGTAFGSISVDPVLIDRLRGREATGGRATAIRRADRTLEELRVPHAIVRELALALAVENEASPMRIVLRGRRGSGRTSLVAAFAAQVERALAVIDCSRMPRAGKAMSAVLHQELLRARLRGCVPVISGLELADPSDAEGFDQLKQVVRDHPGPLAIRTTPEASLPLDAGHLELSVPALGETERAAFWRHAVEREGLVADNVDDLAARYRLGPGLIAGVCAQVRQRRDQEHAPGALDAAAALDELAAQHIATRLAHVATHVTRVARFEQVALPEDVIDSIREFIARSHHRRTVLEQWGFDAKLGSARGTTALFYGAPGTGKSMVAGLIARELGLELYRVDLARVVSKWIGETEKNLAEVFDAAEDGQVVVLFDEADSLFAKRTEVRSSVDRYANLEVNYLLQRLDTFEGVCILTTNLEGSIDPAFKRRMALRLQFPFPDEDTRVRLWAAHIPADVPTRGDFDFLELARRFPISGGYIRNSALRAAFLAAQEATSLGQEHLLRAIALEYRELGKLTSTGRIE